MSTRESWGEIFLRLERGRGAEDSWLERWWDVLETGRESPILDLGCGAGHDARALDLTRRRAPKAETRDVDLARGLPLPDSRFRVIVASLSLHYFPWRQTLEILDDVRRCTTPDGYLLARLNSTNDAYYYAAADKREIEENYYLIAGSPKRLFDRESVETLLATGWRLVDASERTTDRYGYEKTLWETAARKVAG